MPAQAHHRGAHASVSNQTPYSGSYRSAYRNSYGYAMLLEWNEVS